MAGLKWAASVAGLSISASTAKTVIQVTAPTNQRVQLTRLLGGFYGVSGTEPSVRVRVLRQTSAGTGRSTITPHKIPNLGSETIQSTLTSGSGATVEPTNAGAGAERLVIPVHPQGNFVLSLLDAEGMPITLIGGERVGIEVTLGGTPATCTVDMTVEGIE